MCTHQRRGARDSYSRLGYPTSYLDRPSCVSKLQGQPLLELLPEFRQRLRLWLMLRCLHLYSHLATNQRQTRRIARVVIQYPLLYSGLQRSRPARNRSDCQDPIYRTHRYRIVPSSSNHLKRRSHRGLHPFGSTCQRRHPQQGHQLDWLLSRLLCRHPLLVLQSQTTNQSYRYAHPS